MNPYMHQYQQNQVQTASREQILIMLYDGAIRFVGQARQAIENGDRLGRLEPISRAMAIISELSNSLDHSIGGEVAENLDALYNFMIRSLIEANRNVDAKPLETVENLLKTLRATWAEAIQIVKDEGQAANGEEQGYDAGSPDGYKRLSAAL
ncbi:MAG: flagellar export chaperone FliS [Deltaproteobacteria bacterium]|nr:flagellar export chaperone FliS [Deltaproteobacteria bacterium]